MVKAETNIDQLNPVAPMAQQVPANERPNHGIWHFSPSHPKITKEPRVFRIVLNSADRASGSLTDALYNITLPDNFLSTRYTVVLESIYHDQGTEANASLDKYAYSVRLEGLNSPYSFHSQTGLPTNILAVVKGRTYLNPSPVNMSGLLGTDHTLFNRPVRLQLTTQANGVDITQVAVNDWTATLLIYDFGSDH